MSARTFKSTQKIAVAIGIGLIVGWGGIINAAEAASKRQTSHSSHPDHRLGTHPKVFVYDSRTLKWSVYNRMVIWFVQVMAQAAKTIART